MYGVVWGVFVGVYIWIWEGVVELWWVFVVVFLWYWDEVVGFEDGGYLWNGNGNDEWCEFGGDVDGCDVVDWYVFLYGVLGIYCGCVVDGCGW